MSGDPAGAASDRPALGRLARLGAALLGFAALVAVWQALSASGRFTVLLLPPPGDVLATALDLARRGQLLDDALASLQRVTVGFLLGAATGVTLGVALGAFRPLSLVVRPVLEALRPIPGIAWIPLAILWFGIGDASSYFLVALTSFFPVFVSGHAAVTSIESRYVDLARCLGTPRRMVVLEVLLPAALPRILTGIRVGLGVAWMTVVAAELVAARSGLGYMIELNRTLLQTSAVLVGMALIGLIGFAMTMLLERVERGLTPWVERR